MTNQTFTSNQYVQSLMRIIAPVLALVISIFALFGLFNIVTAANAEVAESHETGLRQTYATLESEMDNYTEDALSVARSTELIPLLDDPTTDPRPAMRSAVSLIAAHPDEYQAIRLIARSGRVHGEVVNNNGTPANRARLVLGNISEFADTDAFNRLINGDTGQTLIGGLRLQTNERGQIVEPPTIIMDMFVPVYSQNIPRGVVHMEVNASDFFGIVEAADGTLIDAQTDRRAILTNTENLVLADSGAISNTYRRNLEARTGNIQDEPLYQDVVQFARANPSGVLTQIEFPRIYSSIEIEFPGVEDPGWELFIVDQWFPVYSGALLVIALITFLSVGSGVGATYWLRTRIATRLASVEQSDTLMENLATPERQRRSLPPPMTGSDLLDSARLVRDRIGRLSEEVERQMQRRNRDLQVAGRIGREAATQRELEDLAHRSINLICNELGFYHAQIFLLDNAGVNAILHYSRGEAGQKLIDQGHQLPVGSDTVIGTVTGEQRVVIVNETQNTSDGDTHRFNPLLPDTRAEMGLPLLVQDDVLGALDLQSLRAGAFDEDDIPTYQLIADQLAIAIYNAQLREQTQERIEQVDRLNRQLTRDAWNQTEARLELDEYYGASDVKGRLQAPISIRGEVIGSLDADLPDDAEFSEGDRAILQAVAERVALAIENARLFQETQTSLSETSILYQLSRRLNEANTLEDILQGIIITVMPEASGGQVWLFEDSIPGVKPEQVRVAVDLQIEPRPQEHMDWVGRQLRMDRHPFFDELSPIDAVAIQDIGQQIDDDPTLERFFREVNGRDVVFIPLNIRGVWKGFLSIIFSEQRQFSESQRRIHNAVVGQAGVAIDNRLLLRQTEESLARQEKLYSASRIINTTRRIPDLVYAAVATASDPTLDFWLGLLEGTPEENDEWPPRSRVIAQSSMGSIEETNYVHEIHVRSNSPMRNREPEVLVDPGSDLEDVPAQIEWIRELGFEFMAIFPLFSENRPIALFYIVSETPYELSSDDYEVYRALTGQMSTQIQNARLLQRTEDTLKEIRRLYVATRAISGAQELDDIYDAATQYLALPYTDDDDATEDVSISVLLARPEPVLDAPDLEYVYQWSGSRDSTPDIPIGTLLPRNNVPLGEYIQNSDDGLLVYHSIADEAPDNDDLHDLLTGDEGATAAAVVPLWSRQRWLGVLIVRTTMPELLDESYTRFMQSIADQIAIAIENQSLLEETEFERQRLNTILSTLPTGVLVLEPETFLPRQHNQQVEDLLGQSIDYDRPFTAENYNMYRTGTNSLYPVDEMPIRVAQRQSRQVQSDDVLIIHDETDQTDLLISAAPIYDNQGRQQAIVAAFQNISALRSMENTMQENLQETVMLYETQRTLAEAETLDDLLNNVMAQIAMQQPSDAYILLQQDDDIRVARNLMQSIDDVEALHPILGREIRIINDVSRSNELAEDTRSVLTNIGARSVLVLPMRAKARPKPLGWVMIIDTEPEAFTGDQERTLNSITDMASTAIDNNYLVKNIQEALQETADLYNASSSISRARDLHSAFDAIENALQSLNPTMYGIYLWDEEGLLYDITHNTDEILENGLQLDSLLRYRLPSTGLFVSDINTSDSDDRQKLQMDIAQAGTIQSFGLINLRVKDIRGGRIFIGFDEPHRFGEAEERFINAVTDSASVVIDNKLLVEQIQNSLQEQSVLYQASKALLETSQPSDIVEVLVNFVIEPHVNQVFIAMLNRRSWDMDAASVNIVASWQSGDDVNLEGITLRPDEFPAWTQLSTDRLLTIEDVETSDLNMMEQTSIQSLEARSVAIIPLRVPGRALGAIWIASEQPHRYNHQNLRIFQTFGEQASITLEAERLLQQSEARAAQLQTASAISQSVTQILDLNVLLPQVVDLIQGSFGYDHVQVFLMDEEKENAVLQASTGEAGEKLLAINHSLPRGSESVIGMVTETGEPTIALDTAEADVTHKPNRYLPLTRSEMALPLLIKGEVVGALDVQSNRANAFTEDDVRALETLASQIAVAIDNARLYEGIERSASDMSFLFEITTAAAAADTLEESLVTIANSVDETLDAQGVVIFLPQSYEDPYGNQKILMEPAAASMNSGLAVGTLDTVELDDEMQLIARASRSLQAEILPYLEELDNYTPLTDGAKSAVLVPIDTAGNLIGLLAVESTRTAAYDQDSVTLLRTLAGSISAIIQNTLLLEQLQTTNSQLREMDRLKSQFLASMSHELRTPLNSIIGFSRVMLKGIDGPLTDMQEQDLQTIYTSGNHLLNLINDILDQAKIEANELNLKFGYFKIQDMVESVKSIAIGMMKDKPLSLEVEMGNNLPDAYGDEFRTRQILLNLVSNAIKFTQEGSIVIRAFAVEDPDGDRLIQMEVEDTGIGIAESDMPILFEQFRQVDSSLTRTVGGTGLGLPISKSLTELQGGQMYVESEINVGSTFAFTIPTTEGAEEELEARKLAKQKEAKSLPKTSGNGTDESQSGLIRKEDVERARQMHTESQATQSNGDTQEDTTTDKKKKKQRPGITQNIPMMNNKREVVLIEDSKDMVDQFRRTLQREGFEVTTAEHPAYAEAMIGQLRPSLVILDVNFADGQGWTVLKNLKERDDTFDIPVIVTTMSEDSERAYRLGAHTFIERPFLPDDLLEAVLKAEAESKRERILIIDDQPEAIRLLRQLLDEHGDFRIFSAESGDEGISLVARRHPDLIILDLRMPDKDGFAVLDELRENPETAKIPVLVVTGDVDLSATELEKLQDIDILQKTTISEADYEKFMDNVRAYLEANQ